MYQRFAAVYDAIYRFKNYAEESEKVASLIRAKNPNARTLLDVACGSGAHLQYLKSSFDCAGVDLSQDLIQIAREKLPDVEFTNGDMRDFKIDRKFDAVTCLFSAIAYMPTLEGLGSAIDNMSKHLASGGVMIIEPWIPLEKFIPGHYDIMTAQTDSMKIARANASRLEGNQCVMDFHFLVTDKDGTEHFVETHRLGFFSDAEYLGAFRKAGLTAEFQEGGLIGRGLYVATKP